MKSELQTVGAGDHVCLPYKNLEEAWMAMADFLRDGATRAERCLILAPLPLTSTIKTSLLRLGLPIQHWMNQTALLFDGKGPVEDTPDHPRLAHSIELARLAGFSGLRVIILHDSIRDAGCGLFHPLPHQTPQSCFEVASLCLFDQAQLNEHSLSRILCEHPLTLVGDKICRTPLATRPPTAYPIPIEWMMKSVLASEESLEVLEAQNEVLIREAARLGITSEQSNQHIESLTRAIEARDRLLVTIARWLSRPLPALCAHMEDFLSDNRFSPLREEIESCGGHIAAIQRLSRGLDEIAGFLQMQVLLRPEPLDLVAVVRQAAKEADLEDDDDDFEVEVSGVHKLEGVWDRMRLLRLFQSLLRTSKDQGYGAKVMFGVVEHKHTARIQVEFQHPKYPSAADSNSAASRDTMERYHLPVDESDYERLGVALWPARELVRVMGGTLGVSTWAAARVVFVIELPKTPRVSSMENASSTNETRYQ